MKFASILLLTIPAFAQVTVTISPQGTAPVKAATGITLHSATLASLLTCNNGPDERGISTARIKAELAHQGGLSVYSSEVVLTVLQALQDRSVYTRAQKVINATREAVVIGHALLGVFSGTVAAGIAVAPDIAAALLPAVSNPRDLPALAGKLMQDNSTLTLGKGAGGADCHESLVVAIAPTVAIGRVAIQ